MFTECSSYGRRCPRLSGLRPISMQVVYYVVLWGLAPVEGRWWEWKWTEREAGLLSFLTKASAKLMSSADARTRA